MATINFPDTTGQPTDGSFTYEFNGTTYSWDGEKWTSQGSSSSGGSFVKLDDEGTQQDITGGGGLSVLGGITSEFGTDTTQVGNIAPLNDWSVYPARS